MEKDFNSRTPCGVRRATVLPVPVLPQFQLTHPVWGATRRSPSSCCRRRNFNSRTPCGVRHVPEKWRKAVRDFNSRTPCGVRLAPICIAEPRRSFQLTHPVWGATIRRKKQIRESWNFNSRTPCGVRQNCQFTVVRSGKFQLTHPVWGATRR